MSENPTTCTRVELDDWTLAPAAPLPDDATAQIEVGQQIPAVVPGCVHTDLMAAGLIPDPYLDTNEADQLWIGRTRWSYTTQLPPREAPAPGERVDLVCDGLDTVATIRLDGEVVASTENMHRSWRFDITDRAAAGGQLEIEFAGAIDEVERREQLHGDLPHVNHRPFNQLRKMACSFGWDWGIETATAGIWRPIAVESWRTARLASVLVDAAPTSEGGRVTLRLDVQRADDDAELVARLSVAGAQTEVAIKAGSSHAETVLEVPGVQAWWPVGHGDQPLYDLQVELFAAGGDCLDIERRRVGFRTVRIDQPLDEQGGIGFQLVVNDRPIMVRGVNWIPDDAFPTRVDRARVEQRLNQALDANCNLVRVWGGGIFESDDFYAVCDELGLLVWQDCLLACAFYSEDEPFWSEFEAEVRDNLTRIGHHPALAVVNGNNENIWAHHDWGWEGEVENRAWGLGYYLDLFPRIVDELLPTIPYTPGSPFAPEHSPVDDDLGPNDERWGTMHLWDAWNATPATSYRTHNPRFVAEFGWQSPPTWSTLTESIHDDPLTPTSPGMLVHQKAGDGQGKMLRGMEGITGVPEPLEAWHWAAQYTQVDAARTGIGWFRSLEPHCTGTIWWQLNDCWPVNSWAAVDGYGRRKPLWYALREIHQPRMLTIQPGEGDALTLTVLNDTDEPWAGQVRVRLLDLDGTSHGEHMVSAEVAPRGRQQVALDQAVSQSAADRFVLAELDQERAWWWFVAPKDRPLPAAEVSVEAQPAGDGVDLHLTAQTMLVDAMLLVDKADPQAVADQGLVTLLPGEQVVVHVRTEHPDADFAATLVSSNDFAATV